MKAVRIALACLVAAGLSITGVDTARAVTDGVRTLEVSQTSNVDPAGQTVRVTGSGYDTFKGIYVALCVVPAPGQPPSPCGGGVDMSGTSEASHWISSNPPPYGVGVAQPYGPGGTFDVTLRIGAALNAATDCRFVQCAVVTRNDHTRSTDRSQDVIVPISFRGPTVSPPPPGSPSNPSGPTAGSTAGAPSIGAVDPGAALAPGAAASPQPTDVAGATVTTEAAPTSESTTSTTTDAASDDVDEELAASTSAATGDDGGGGTPIFVIVLATVVALAAVTGLGVGITRRRRAP